MSLFPRARSSPAPGAFHLPDWLSPDEQRHIVSEWRGWSVGPAGQRRVRLPYGGRTSVKMVCLGWQWVPYTYERTVDGVPVTPMPRWLADLGRRALADAHGEPLVASDYSPDVALVNFYDAEARLGMHQDADEGSDAPIVSMSIGDHGIFRFGNTTTRTRPYVDIELHSGDVIVFGGPARYAFHGVRRILPGTSGVDTGLGAGRLNITLRVTGRGDSCRGGSYR